MILFIFEGDDREPHIYKTIERLYFPKNNDNIICSFGNNIYDLYNEMKSYDGNGDIVAVMKERSASKGLSILDNIRRTDISEIFLFFDYDFQHSQLSLEEINRRVEEMLLMFDDETDNGKLYINYPMIESIRYTKELPDNDYCHYVVSRDDCGDFKHLAHEFSFYDNLDHILFNDDEKPKKEKFMVIKDNWHFLKIMNVYKANWLIYDKYFIPALKSDINQLAIFKSQKRKYVEVNESVAVLNAFPIFIYDYMKS